MRRLVLAVLAVAMMAVLAATPAAGVDGTLPGGTAISVDITSPTSGTFVQFGNDLTVTGTASIGTGSAVKDTSIVYLIDVSGSMTGFINDLQGSCGNAGVPTRLDCAKFAAIGVNTAAALPNSPILDGAVISFSSVAQTVPSNTGLTTNLGSLNASITGLQTGGGTNFQNAVNKARDVLAGSTAANKIIVMISDGVSGGDVSDPGLPSGTVIRAFAIGGVGCGSGQGSLAAVAALTANGTCTEVSNANIGGLGSIIGATIGSTLNSVTVAVDGGAEITAITTPALPVAGPAAISFTATVPAPQLPLGTRTLCATVTGTTGGGQGSVTECVTIDVVGATVDCGAVAASLCTLQATDGGVSAAVVTGLGGFDKSLAITAGLAGANADCLGQGCLTAFNIQFADEGVAGSGKVVELVVVMSRANSTPPGRAKAFLEVGGVTTEITNRCGGSGEVLPCVKINRVSGGRTQYLVRFDGDPLAKFR